jgi:beta-galactosidase
VKEQPFYDRLYAQLVREAGVRRVLDAGLPAGVTAQARTDGSRDYVFVMNFSGEAQQVRLDGRSYTDMESGQPVAGGLELPVNGVRILQRARV